MGHFSNGTRRDLAVDIDDDNIATLTVKIFVPSGDAWDAVNLAAMFLRKASMDGDTNKEDDDD